MLPYFYFFVSNFNPRSREGSDSYNVLFRPDHHISIHAPVKGATDSRPAARAGPDISIHAPVKGATVWDRIEADVPPISIHAPVKGATILR